MKHYTQLNLNDELDLNVCTEIKSKVKEIENNLFKGTIIRSKVSELENNEK